MLKLSKEITDTFTKHRTQAVKLGNRWKLHFPDGKVCDLANKLSFNREVKRERPDLLNSMNTWGNCTTIILVSSTLITGRQALYIADGQNRAKAAGLLGLPTHADIHEEPLNDMESLVYFVSSLNTSQRRWRPYDYCYAYASLGNDNYKTLLKLHGEYGHSISAIGSVFGNTGGRSRKRLNEGTFRLTSLQKGRDTLDLVKVLKPRMLTKMIVGFHNARLKSDTFSFSKFKTRYQERYDELRASSINRFEDIFFEYGTS